MTKSIGLWQFVGFLTVSLGGTLLHFSYDWLGKPIWIASFSGVNESTWEHMKLLFWPAFIFAVVQSFFFRGREDFWCIKLRGTLLGMILIPVIFYTYNGIIGKSPDWLNIAIFFVSAAILYLYETNQVALITTECNRPKLAFAALYVIGILFIIFTFKTPKINIFKDPITNTYGIS